MLSVDEQAQLLSAFHSNESIESHRRVHSPRFQILFQLTEFFVEPAAPKDESVVLYHLEVDAGSTYKIVFEAIYFLIFMQGRLDTLS